MTATRALPGAGILFTLPPGRHADVPPEHRGIARDQVRLLVATPDRIEHVRFSDVGRFLHPGDVVVVNTSPTRPAAIDGATTTGAVVVHLAAVDDEGVWTVEVRRVDGTAPVLDAAAGTVVTVTGGGRITLVAPVAPGPDGVGTRLWRARTDLEDIAAHLRRHGRPIRYGSGRAVDLAAHQTVFAGTDHSPTGAGSAEMASAGRPFSTRLVTRLVSRGVLVVPLTLHAGVSSPVAGEPPQPEWMDVPPSTAAIVEAARRDGRRVIAVGTTVTRALESATGPRGVAASRGWTDLVLGPDRPARTVGGLITGWHEADASHLLLLQAVAGAGLVQRAYSAAVEGPYLWHEFGDSCLLLPRLAGASVGPPRDLSGPGAP